MDILAKFGGSSLSSSQQFKKVKDIILSDSNRQIIVVSAPGKDDLNQAKMTDMLLLLHAHIEYNIDYSTLVNSIKKRFLEIIESLEIKSRFELEFNKLIKELRIGISKDYLVSRGEYFNAVILSEYLGFEFLDAKKILYLNHNGSIDYDKSEKMINKFIDTSKKYVIPGFYANTPNQQIRTFPRGGSDLTGSIICRILNLKLYENWTDVSGLFVADPRIVENPERIENITYDELRELSYRGASVIQQESIIPIQGTSTSLIIKNTNSPFDNGTFISNEINKIGNIITGLAGQVGFTSITILKDSSKNFSKVLKDVLNIFIKYNITIEHIPTGIDNFSIITKTDTYKKVYFDIIDELTSLDGILDVKFEDDISLVAIVGRNMSSIPGVSGKIFSILGDNNINIRVIAQASKEISIIIGVNSIDYNKTLRLLYNRFYL